MIIEYLTALEGEFWVRLRGAGRTYGADLSHSTEERHRSTSAGGQAWPPPSCTVEDVCCWSVDVRARFFGAMPTHFYHAVFSLRLD